MRKHEIKLRIAELQEEAAKKLKIEHTDILDRYWRIATGDVNDIVSVERHACRYCHGQDHAYQWKTEREYREAFDAAAMKLSVGPSRLYSKTLVPSRLDLRC